ncbi:MAG: carboxylating nicotinate-nucleotide diphosphorylase [Vampirovibrionales bacterium]|nr:carboxylating nicotinate-nucleotide diphosphorylase [Vampirovibrionales bacterium]
MNNGIDRALLLEPLVRGALLEDLAQGDITTDNLPALAAQQAQATARARQPLTVSGLQTAALAFTLTDARLCVEPLCADGDTLAAGAALLRVSGPACGILRAERTALNFLQHLCGVATRTRQFADALAGTGARIADTRKTTPGLRLLEKQAVIDGGGAPHRYHLGMAAMLKDNHIAACGGIASAVAALRARLSHLAKIEVEADTLAQAREALEAGADAILLDNMSLEALREAVAMIGDRAIVEASGGITLENARAVAQTGVRLISTSALTLGAPAVDIGLDWG